MSNPAPLGIFRAFNGAGAPLAGGLLKTFLTGTATAEATFTDATLATANATTITLDANGEAPVWLGSKIYRFDLFDNSVPTPVRQPGYPVDGIQSDSGRLADSAGTANGDALVAMKRTFTGASATTEHDWQDKQEINAVSDAGVPNDGVTVADSLLAAAVAAATNKTLYLPAGTYLFNQMLITAPIRIRTDGPATIFKRRTTELADSPHVWIASGNVELQTFASIGNIALDGTTEHNHALLIAPNVADQPPLENIKVGVIHASNAKGDGLAISGTVGSPVRHVRVEGVLCANVWRSRVSVIGGENIHIGYIGSLGGNTQFGYRDFDVEPNNANTQYLDAIVVDYINGARVQFATYTPAVGVRNPIGNVRIKTCILDADAQTDTTPSSTLYVPSTAATGGEYFDHVIFEYLSVKNFDFTDALIGDYHQGPTITGTPQIAGILQIDRFVSKTSGDAATVWKALFRAEGLTQFWIGEANVDVPSVLLYIASGAGGDDRTRYNWGYLGRILTNGRVCAYGAYSRFSNIKAACAGNAVFNNVLNSRADNLTVTACTNLALNCTDLKIETGTITTSGAIGSSSTRIRGDHVTINGSYYNFWSFDGSYMDALRLKDTSMWPDATTPTGKWRTLRGTLPTSDTAGTVIGTQA